MQFHARNVRIMRCFRELGSIFFSVHVSVKGSIPRRVSEYSHLDKNIFSSKSFSIY